MIFAHPVLRNNFNCFFADEGALKCLSRLTSADQWHKLTALPGPTQLHWRVAGLDSYKIVRPPALSKPNALHILVSADCPVLIVDLRDCRLDAAAKALRSTVKTSNDSFSIQLALHTCNFD